MSKIDLPRYYWFINRSEGKFVTNTYSGSIGTVPESGCINTYTFHYRVYADTSSNEESSFRLVAESYIRHPWILAGKKNRSGKSGF